MEAKTRKSNIELFRIVIMLWIIGSHYVMNGGISKMFGPHNLGVNTLLWGKILQNVDYAMTELAIPHFIVSVIFVYSVCVVIDLLRIYLIERPLFSFIQLRIKKKD